MLWAFVAVAWSVPEGFWEVWGDGQAEVAAYAVTVPRYGQLRRGEMVVVTVTETFTRGQRVKSDGGHDDEFPVVKQHVMLDFQTGIYDYDTATSTFVPIDGAVPTKVAFSAQEWCGSTADVWVLDGPTSRWDAHSYFDGEGDRRHRLPVPTGAVVADALPWLVRGLAGEVPEGDHPYMAPLRDLRFHHVDPSWGQVTLSKSGQETVVVPAGSFEVDVVSAAVSGGTRTRYFVERGPHRRVVRIASDDGFDAMLTGVNRSAYWTQNGEGAEAGRVALGLPASPWHAP